MENVLTAIVVVFIILLAVLTLSHAVLSSQTMLITTWEQTAARLDEQSRTHLTPRSMTIEASGSLVELIIHNSGSTRLAAFERWDVLVQYRDTAGYHIRWLPYVSGTPISNEWAVREIYLDAVQAVPEAYEPTILNPGEEALLLLQLVPPVAPGETLMVTLATQGGATLSSFGTRNLPPVLATNAGMVVTSGRSGVLHPTHLLTTDADDAASQLTYTITLPPTQGSLTPATSFTQAQIDAGLVSYSHAGSGDDAFEFTVSDGTDVIGIYTFSITAELPPMLVTNPGFNLPEGAMGFIQPHLLETIDADSPPDALVYTVISPPVRGSLNLGSQFTQADINAGALTYTHLGGGADSFQFTVSDGTTIIGAYTVLITINP